MHKYKYLSHIIKALSTKKNITDGVNQRKKFTVTRKDIETYGKDSIMSLLKGLEKVPGLDIEVKWERFNGVEVDVQYFTIPKNKLGVLCELAGEKNPADIIKKQTDIINGYIKDTEGLWLNKYYLDRLKSSERGTAQEKVEDIDFNTGLIRAAKNNNILYYRTFSQDVYHGSKKFEEYKCSYATIIKNYHPQADEDMKEKELLELCNLYSYSQTFEYVGDLDVILDNCSVIGSGVSTGMILNTKTLREIKAVRIGESVKSIITIENKDNFYSMTYNPETIYIFAHGFFSPIEQKLCKLINDACSTQNIAFKHWGDMDYGGIRIFKHVKKLFTTITPHKMSASDYMDSLLSVPGYPIKASTRLKLEKINAEELSDLKGVILEHGKCFEQEEQLL